MLPCPLVGRPRCAAGQERRVARGSAPEFCMLRGRSPCVIAWHGACSAAAMPDLRYALRQLAQSPGFTAVALLTLTLGMGANTAFFSVLYGVVLRQPPYPSRRTPRRAVYNVWSKEVSATAGGSRAAEFRGLPASASEPSKAIAASDLGRMTLDAARRSRQRSPNGSRCRASRPNLFSLRSASCPARGRGIRTGDEHRGPLAVAAATSCGSRQFGGAEDILDRTIRLNGIEHAIVGVMPAGFAYPEPDMGAWMPLDLTPRGDSDRNDHYLAAIGRLAAGDERRRRPSRSSARRPRAAARGAGRVSGRRAVDASAPSRCGRRSTAACSCRSDVLMAAAASVLLIACVNVAIMSLLRARQPAPRRSRYAWLSALTRRDDRAAAREPKPAVLCALGAAGRARARRGHRPRRC